MFQIIGLAALLLLLVLDVSLNTRMDALEAQVDKLINKFNLASKSRDSAEKDEYLLVTSDQDIDDKKSHFTFSPDKKRIAFIQNVFDEYGNGWDMYWALKVLDTESGEEKTLIVDNAKMSSYEWVNDKTIRLFHSAGTGVRVFLDVEVSASFPIFTKNFEGTGSWQPDLEYVQKAIDVQKAYREYAKVTTQ